MNFWQLATCVFMVLAFMISLSEAWQLILQRRLMRQILDRMRLIDVDAALERTEAATRSGLETLEKALSGHLRPMSEKVAGLDVELLIAGAIDRAMEKLDAKAFAEVAADVIVARAKEAMPGIIEQAKAQVVEGTPGAEQALDIAGFFEDSPVLGMLALAAQQRMVQPQQGQQQQGNRRRL